MNKEDRMKKLAELKKEAERDALIKKIAEDINDAGISPEDYAKNFVNRLVDESKISILEDEDPFLANLDK